MRLRDINDSLKEIDFCNGTSIIRNDWQCTLRCDPVPSFRYWIVAFGDNSGRTTCETLAEAIKIARDDGAKRIRRAY